MWSYIIRSASDAGTANTVKPAITLSLFPAPVAVAASPDGVELPLLLELVAACASKKYPPTPVELEHSSAPNVRASVEKVISAH